MIEIPIMKLHVSALLSRAERSLGLYTYPSDNPCAGYVTDGREILVLTTRKGYLRMKDEEATTLIEELQNIIEDNERFRKRK